MARRKCSVDFVNTFLQRCRHNPLFNIPHDAPNRRMIQSAHIL
jgi:hypothetical protein